MIWIAFVAFSTADECDAFVEKADQGFEIQCVLRVVPGYIENPIRPRLRPTYIENPIRPRLRP